MPGIIVVTTVGAPQERVFDLARDVGLHLRAAERTGERLLEGRREGIREPGERATWSARHLGLRWRMTVRITGFERPRWFREEMSHGPFSSFRHDRHFEAVRDGTRIHEELVFRAPGGLAGRAVERLGLTTRLRRILEERNRVLREAADAETRAAPPVPGAPTIRPETTTDRDAVRAVLVASFPTDAEARLVDALRAAGRTAASLVAVADGEVVGHVLFSPVEVGDGAAAARGVGLAPLAVAAAHRRRGVGAALVRAGLEACRRAGFGFAVVLGDPAYYGRFGFRRAADAGLQNEFGADEEFRVLELRPDGLAGVSGVVRYGAEFRHL